MTAPGAAPQGRAGGVDALDARDLYRFFRAGEEETLALRGVSVRVRPGETVAVVGPSGSGKSTLVACLAGLDEPDGGVVRVGGERISHRPEAERARVRARRIGVLLQSGNLIAHLSVRDNIRLARIAAPGKSTQDIAELLEQVGLAHRARALPQELAGGELARAGLAVALANDPDVLLADEPTGELDGQTEQRVLNLLRERASAGHGVLIVTHSPEAVRIADQVIPLRDGRIRT
ncbi:ABC transporter ATP-binding protein [Kitasatospora atroaurantiaca]|uniref:Putative ABC transport system ATP-binding protein n=1 Tax=Kitasatospora atroaurantiaca TaxID=285545 RepID=A0A561EJ73_9ACTN|nr:ATP-binding cassette domain-containing protein [Kitasatospora atroaurantiaca]TWE15659.1 putative ABC transport system ATP-binding protein [Kitasatospora atroaurantiaca]